MRLNQLKKLVTSNFLIIARIPNYRRKALEQEDFFIPEYVDVKIVELFVGEKGKQCSVLVRDGFGRDIQIAGRNVLKFAGSGDFDGARFKVRPVLRRRIKRRENEQLRLLDYEKICR